MKRPLPYQNGDPLKKSTSKLLYALTGYKRTEEDIWRSSYGQRKYIVRVYILWFIKVYYDCRVFGSCR